MKNNLSRKNNGTRNNKADGRTAKYKASYCLKWLMKNAWEWDRRLIFIVAGSIFFSVALYVLNLYIPSVILEKLQTSDRFSYIAVTIVGLMSARLLFQLTKDLMNSFAQYARRKNGIYNIWCRNKKIYQSDFYLRFDEKYAKLSNRSVQILNDLNGGSLIGIFLDFSEVAVNVICFFMFGSVVSLLSPWVLLLLIAGVSLNYFLKRKVSDKNNSDRELRDENGRKIGYYVNTLPEERLSGKDVRVFGFMDYIEKRWSLDIGEYIRLTRIVQNRWMFVFFFVYLVELARDAAAYLYLLSKAAGGGITPAEFVLYFTAISQMSQFMTGIFDYFSKMHESMLLTSDWIEFLCEEHGNCNHGKGIPIPEKRPVSVELRDVSFRYPGRERNVLEHVSMKIEAGEKISLVGINGAGKTTMTLLMCGLLLPDEGEVLIDGHPLKEYNRDELYSLFAMVPQDYSILPVSIAENIGMCQRDMVDDKRLWECLEKVELAEKIRLMKRNVETGMNKKFDEDAVELSGGEKQKLLLARALYRDAAVLILDEPTAALDPIAEDEVYRKYHDFSKNATSLFISHRLASTRFCDRIYLLDGSKIAEMGTHEELMARNGKYAEMFRVQSKYYEDGKKRISE